MKKIEIKTTSKAIPMCYAYSTPEIKRHYGWVKIGYTEKQDVDERIKQQAHTIDVIVKEEWRGNAIFEDGSGEFFTDHEFHAYLKKLNIEYDNSKKNEWFHVDGPTSKKHFNDFRENRGILDKLREDVITYELREEQAKAVSDAIAYMNNHKTKNEYLWNCKPRFGKTLSAYDLMLKLNCKNTLIVTNRPAIANSWYSDYVQFVGDNDYYFVSETDALRGKTYVLSQKDFEYKKGRIGEDIRQISFVSLQDLKGSIYFGGTYNKLKEVKETEWDLLIIDEAHEGVDTYKTDVAFDNIKRRFTLHLSGTPFKALASNKFDDDAIYNWTYADEQKMKREWKSPEHNPYEDLPKLNLFTYQMSEIIKDELEKGISIDGEVEEYAFDLNEFFRTNDNGTFIHDSSVNKFLDALTTMEKYPFSTENLRNEIKHSLWLLDRVASAKALLKKLENHPVFKDYRIILAAGDGKQDDLEESRKSYNKVKYAIEHFDKTITLSVGQLTTGITVPEWTAVLMLCNCKSPSLYMQAAFRSQNPCMFSNGTEFYRKENAYVFDFDPARTLIIFEQFANDLSKKTVRGGGSAKERKENITELLNFFPVIGEDELGEMIELDAEKVLTIPRKIKSTEVVKKGFMSNFLFQNIGNIFNAPKELLEIIEQFEPITEPKSKKEKISLPEDINTDDEGNPIIDNETIIGVSKELFGNKIYGVTESAISEYRNNKDKVEQKELFELIKDNIGDELIDSISTIIKSEYEKEGLKKSDQRQIERQTRTEVEYVLNRLSQETRIEERSLEQEYKDAIERAKDTGEIKKVEKEFKNKKKELEQKTIETIKNSVDSLTESVSKNAVEMAERKVKEHKINTVEENIRDRLRSFSKTIPSFLMAYGDDKTTLANFDKIIPDEVFKEVTSISLEEFRKLRDGGIYRNENGEEVKYPGLFDSIVFDDSIKEFLNKKSELSNYFDENATEDIFDYIPPQKTNQIFTPKKVVKDMVDMLEKENPGCFDNDKETFADLYMKSGLYIAEIVKRLYKSKKMKNKYPNEQDRLRHIFKHQVYGLAPTEIIYRIAANYLLGFDKKVKITEHNLRMLNSLPYAENGTLEKKLDELYKTNGK